MNVSIAFIFLTAFLIVTKLVSIPPGHLSVMYGIFTESAFSATISLACFFVATKKQAKDIVAEKASSVNMPYITERWPGGMLTNFVTIRKAVKKMNAIDRMKADGTFETLSKKEKLQVDRQRAKLEKNLGSISDMTRLPGAIFVVDTLNEKISVQEAQKLNIPIFAMVDTNSDPNEVDFIIPSNDDASKSIEKILDIVCSAIKESLEERKKEKEIDEQKKLEEAEALSNADDTDASEEE